MSEAIQPALTPDEWKVRGVSRGKYGVFQDDEEDGDGETIVSVNSPIEMVRYRDIDIATVPPALMPAALALVNDALPAGHALKVTHEDVEALGEIAESIRQLMQRFEAELSSQPFFDPIAGLSRQWQNAERLAEKLAAILPPPEPTQEFRVWRLNG